MLFLLGSCAKIDVSSSFEDVDELDLLVLGAS
jgi:hypothetical protein